MTRRRLKAHNIVAKLIVRFIGGRMFLVEAGSSQGTFYYVTAEEAKDRGTCNCKDAKGTRSCKHILAVWVVIEHFGTEVIAGWAAGFEVPKIPFEGPKRSRKRGDQIHTFESDYAGGRRREKVTISYPPGEPSEATRRRQAEIDTPTRVPILAKALADFVASRRSEEPAAKGGQELPFNEQIFALLMKAYLSCSYPELMGQLKLYKMAGLISHVPCRGSLIHYQHSASINEALKEALELTAGPVRKIETMVAFDGTGFGTCITANSHDEKHRNIQQRARNKFMTAIAAVGCATNMVVDVAFCRTDGAELNYFDRLIVSAKSRWERLCLALADGLYGDDLRIQKAKSIGLTLICPPTKYKESTYRKTTEGAWLFDWFHNPNGSFDEIYRYRSKIESVFSAIKRTMGWHLRMRLTKIEKIILGLLEAPTSAKKSTEVEAPAEAEAQTEAEAPENPTQTAEGESEQTNAKELHLTADEIGFGRENELLARFIVWNLRVVVILEKLHDQLVDFVLETHFRPIAPERLSGYHPMNGEAPDLPKAA